MGFEMLLGNDRLKQNLSSALSRNRVSHFYLISGPEGSGKHTLARLLSAAILCKQSQKPCLCCSACKKVLSDNHPDLITVIDEERKQLPVEEVRKARADMYIQPNEADHKIYLFPQELNIQGQNALLKVLEEPPKYGVFILLTDNPDKILPTVRSRCTELSLTALPEATLRAKLREEFPQASAEAVEGAIYRSGGYLGQAKTVLTQVEDASQNTEKFLHSYLKSDPIALMQVLVPMEKWKRDAFVEELSGWLRVLSGALAARSGIVTPEPMAAAISKTRSVKEIMADVQALQKAIDYAQGNVSVAAICGYLEWELR